MLTSIDVVCDNTFTIPVIGANPKDSLIVQSLTGLGPPDISLFVGDYARDGGVYTGRRVTTRNPVFTIAINPSFANNETVSGWREILYKAFVDPTVNGDDVTLILHDDILPDRVLTGYAEKFETEPFSADTIVTISMICPDPYIRDKTETVMTGNWTTVPFNYQGTAETGFEVDINVTVATDTLTLDNNGYKMIFTNPDPNATFNVGDVLHVNTKPGERAVTLTAGGVDYDVLYMLDNSSQWLSLHSQSNTLQIYGVDSSQVVAAITSFKYTTTYWGV